MVRQKKYFIFAGIAFILFCVLPETSVAQSKKVDKTVEHRQATLKKQDEAKAKKAEKGLEEKRKEHYKIQTKNTRREMKRNKRHSKRVNNNRKEFFLNRWFRK